MKHYWTEEEIKIASDYFIETFIIDKRKESLSEAAKELKTRLPEIEIGSLKMHLSNSKALAIEFGQQNSAGFSRLDNVSKTHRRIFSEAVSKCQMKSKGEKENV